MMLVVKLTPPHQAVILNPAGGQTHPSPPRGHPPHLLVVKLTPLRQAVILNLCWWPNSPISAQGSSSTPAGGQTWSNSPFPAMRSSSTPAGGQTHPSPPGGQLHPSTWQLVFHRETGNEGRGVMKREEERQYERCGKG